MPLYSSADLFGGGFPGATSVIGTPIEIGTRESMRERAVTFSQFQGSEEGRLAPGWPGVAESAMPQNLAPLRTAAASKALMGPAYGYYTATPLQSVKPTAPNQRDATQDYGAPTDTPLTTRGRYQQQQNAKRGVSSEPLPGSLTVQDLIVVGGIAALLLVVLFAASGPR